MYKVTYLSFILLGFSMQSLQASDQEVSLYETSYVLNDEHEKAETEEQQHVQNFFSHQIDGLSKASKPKK